MRSAYAGGTSLLPPALPTRGRSAIVALGLVLLVALVALTIAATASAAKPMFGIVPQDGALPSDTDLDLMPGAGIDGLRTMLAWGLIEKSPGEYDWSEADAIVRETTNRGIQPLVFIYGTPDWAAAIDNRGCAPGACGAYPPRSEATRKAFGDFAAAAAARYGPGGDFWKDPPPPEIEPCGGLLPPCPLPVNPPPPTEPPCECTEPSPITTWQIWNEQNSPKYFAPNVSVRRYAGMLRSAADGIHGVDPTAEIVLGGMWGPHSAGDVVTRARDYLERLYALGADDSFDSVAIHPYAGNAEASIAQLETARRVVTEAHDRRTGLWVTEIGWAGRGPSDNPYVKGLIGQARILTRALSEFKRRSRSLNLRGVFWYSWRDREGGDVICDWCGHAGLRTKYGAPKPAWRAFVRVAR